MPKRKHAPSIVRPEESGDAVAHYGADAERYNSKHNTVVQAELTLVAMHIAGLLRGCVNDGDAGHSGGASGVGGPTAGAGAASGAGASALGAAASGTGASSGEPATTSAAAPSSGARAAPRGDVSDATSSTHKQAVPWPGCVPVASPVLVLELGCGGGLSSGCVLARVPQAHVVGLDISPAMLAVAHRDVVTRFPGRLSTVQWDLACGLPCRGASQPLFDAILSVSTVQWLFPKPPEVAPPPGLLLLFRDIHRQLSDDGVAVLQVYPDDARQTAGVAAAALDCGLLAVIVVDYPHARGTARKLFLRLQRIPKYPPTPLPRCPLGTPYNATCCLCLPHAAHLPAHHRRKMEDVHLAYAHRTMRLWDREQQDTPAPEALAGMEYVHKKKGRGITVDGRVSMSDHDRLLGQALKELFGAGRVPKPDLRRRCDDVLRVLHVTPCAPVAAPTVAADG